MIKIYTTLYHLVKSVCLLNCIQPFRSMKIGAGSRLPQFTEAQKKRVLGSWDVFYLNHYTTQYYTNATINGSVIGWFGDQGATSTPYDLEGNLIGLQAQSSWLYVVPWGIYKVLMWNWNRYRHATLNGKSRNSDPTLSFIITENGVDVPGESQMPLHRGTKLFMLHSLIVFLK